MIGKKTKHHQQELFVATKALRGSGSPFYRALNRLLEEDGFDDFAAEVCRPFYSERLGRPGLAPGVYFRMLLVGYLERIDSERQVAWRCADSISLREFLGCGLQQKTPDRSTLARTRKRLGDAVHKEVFSRGLAVLHSSGLLRGRLVEGVTAATEAVRSEARTDYESWLEGLAEAARPARLMGKRRRNPARKRRAKAPTLPGLGPAELARDSQSE